MLSTHHPPSLLIARTPSTPSPAQAASTFIEPKPSVPAPVPIVVDAAFAESGSGTVLLIAEGVKFYCHRDLLAFASPFFESVLSGEWRETMNDSSTIEDDASALAPSTRALSMADALDEAGIELLQDDPEQDEPVTTRRRVDARIHLKEETALGVHSMLEWIYPHIELQVTWASVGDILSVARKFDMPLLRKAAIAFLLTSSAGKPILAMKLSEDYGA